MSDSPLPVDKQSAEYKAGFELGSSSNADTWRKIQYPTPEQRSNYMNGYLDGISHFLRSQGIDGIGPWAEDYTGD